MKATHVVMVLKRNGAERGGMGDARKGDGMGRKVGRFERYGGRAIDQTGGAATTTAATAIARDQPAEAATTTAAAAIARLLATRTTVAAIARGVWRDSRSIISKPHKV